MIYNELKGFTPSNLGETKILDVVTFFTRGSAYIKKLSPSGPFHPSSYLFLSQKVVSYPS